MCLHACGCHYRWSAGRRHHRLCRFLGSKKAACARKGKTIEPSPFDKINQLLRGKTSLLYMCSSFYVLDCFSLSSAISCIARQNFDWHRDWWWMRAQRLGSIDWMAQTTQQIYTRWTRKNDYTNATKTKCIDGDNDIKWLLWSIYRKAGAHQERQCFRIAIHRSLVCALPIFVLNSRVRSNTSPSTSTSHYSSSTLISISSASISIETSWYLFCPFGIVQKTQCG